MMDERFERSTSSSEEVSPGRASVSCWITEVFILWWRAEAFADPFEVYPEGGASEEEVWGAEEEDDEEDEEEDDEEEEVDLVVL